MPRVKKPNKAAKPAAEETTPYVPRYLELCSDFAEPLELYVHAKVNDYVYVVGVLTEKDELSTVYAIPVNHSGLRDITLEVEALLLKEKRQQEARA